MCLIVRIISWQDDKDKLKGIFCTFNLGIQEEILNTFIQFTHFNALVKQVVP